MKKRRFKTPRWVSKMCFMRSQRWPLVVGQKHRAKSLSCHGSCFLWKKAFINNLNGFQIGFNYLCHPTEMNKKAVCAFLFYLHVPGGRCLHFFSFQTMVCFPWLASSVNSFNQMLIWHNTKRMQETLCGFYRWHCALTTVLWAKQTRWLEIGGVINQSKKWGKILTITEKITVTIYSIKENFTLLLTT